MHTVHTFHHTDLKEPDIHVLDRRMAATKYTQHAPSMKTACDYLNGWIKKRSHMQKYHPKWWTPEISLWNTEEELLPLLLIEDRWLLRSPLNVASIDHLNINSFGYFFPRSAILSTPKCNENSIFWKWFWLSVQILLSHFLITHFHTVVWFMFL